MKCPSVQTSVIILPKELRLRLFIIVSLLLFAQTEPLRADGWLKSDEQVKVPSKLRFGPKKVLPEESFDLRPTDDNVSKQNDDMNDDISSSNGGLKENLQSDYDTDKTNLQLESGKFARLSMDDMVKSSKTTFVDKTLSPPMIFLSEHGPIEQNAIYGVPVAELDHMNDNIRIAVQSKRRFEFVPVHFDRENIKAPKVIEIVSDSMPLRLHFKSQSAAIVVSQSHMSPPMKPIEETVSMDEPYRLSHTAHKPIIQEVREVIQPYRNVVQTLKPVIEDIRTVVPKDNDVHHNHQPHYTKSPPLGGNGNTGSVGSVEWTPVPQVGNSFSPNMRKLGNELRAPPPRSSPAHQILQQQMQQHPQKMYQTHRYNIRPVHGDGSVKGSESQLPPPRVQRRMELLNEPTNVLPYFHRFSRRHVTKPYANMHFDSTKPAKTYYIPAAKMGRNENKKDDGRLADYFASKDKFHFSAQRYGAMRKKEHDYLDREASESGRFETINSDYAYSNAFPPVGIDEDEDRFVRHNSGPAWANDSENYDAMMRADDTKESELQENDDYRHFERRQSFAPCAGSLKCNLSTPIWNEDSFF